MTSEVIARAIVLAGVDEANEMICLCAEEAINYVLAYCRIDTITEELYAITAHITASIYSRISNDEVVSIKEGDRQIEYVLQDVCNAVYRDRLKPFINTKGKVPSEV